MNNCILFEELQGSVVDIEVEMQFFLKERQIPICRRNLFKYHVVISIILQDK